MPSPGIGAHDTKVRTGLQKLMTDTGGNDDDIACSYFERPAVFAPEMQGRSAATDAQHFMSGAVIMVEWENASPPRSHPVVLAETLLNDGSEKGCIRRKS